MKRRFLCLLFVLTVLGVPFSSEADSLFSPVEEPIIPLDALPTDLEVAAEEAAARKASLPPPLVKKAIPQRAELLPTGSFMILPREAPLPMGTISGELFVEEVGEAPVFPTAALPEPVEGFDAGAVSPALVPDDKGGYKVVRPTAGGTAATGERESKQLMPKVKPKALKSQKKTKNYPNLVKLSKKFTYEMDLATPMDMQKLQDFLAKLAGKKIVRMQAVSTGDVPPLTLWGGVSEKRARYLKEALGAGDNIPLQVIALRQAGAQSVWFMVWVR